MTVSARVDVVIVGGGIVGTHLGQALVSQARTVAIIDCGPKELTSMKAAQPVVTCAERAHLGLARARNHVLGGNGYFWGGGLIRQPDADLANDQLVGNGEQFARWFEKVELQLGLHRAPRRSVRYARHRDAIAYTESEMIVLAGGKRNIACLAIDDMERSGRSLFFAPATVNKFHVNRLTKRITSVEIYHGGQARVLEADSFVIAAGTIDSIILAAQHFKSFLPNKQHRLGMCMHDHLSVPLYRIHRLRRSPVNGVLIPSFERNLVVGRRFELQATGDWNARGFLHFQFLFDEGAPYRALKQILTLRQQRTTVKTATVAINAAIAALPIFAKLAFHRYVNHRLYVSDDVPIVATLDFETFPSEKNMLRIGSSSVELCWDVRLEDERAFEDLFRQASALTTALVGQDMELEALGDFSDEKARARFLHANATDAFHLGGGLAVGSHRSDVVSSDLRITEPCSHLLSDLPPAIRRHNERTRVRQPSRNLRLRRSLASAARKDTTKETICKRIAGGVL
jgi:hypothetical protein